MTLTGTLNSQRTMQQPTNDVDWHSQQPTNDVDWHSQQPTNDEDPYFKKRAGVSRNNVGRLLQGRAAQPIQALAAATAKEAISFTILGCVG